MIKKALGLMLVGGGVALFACADDEATAKFASADSFCAAKAVEECKDAHQACAVTADACKAKRTEVCKAAAILATNQGRTFSSSKAEVCVTKTTDVYRDRTIDPLKEKSFIEACQRAFVGAKGKSTSCGNSYECTGDLVCDIDKGAVCAEKVDKKKDDPCNNPGDTCAEGLYCQSRSTGRFCSEKNKLDAQCGAAAPCTDELRCAIGKCIAKAAAGESCQGNEDCATRYCNPEGKCGARLYPSETGSCKDFGG
jgi:hypothetical protein